MGAKTGIDWYLRKSREDGGGELGDFQVTHGTQELGAGKMKP